MNNIQQICDNKINNTPENVVLIRDGQTIHCYDASDIQRILKQHNTLTDIYHIHNDLFLDDNFKKAFDQGYNTFDITKKQIICTTKVIDRCDLINDPDCKKHNKINILKYNYFELPYYKRQVFKRQFLEKLGLINNSYLDYVKNEIKNGYHIPTIARNPNITWEDVEANSDIKWDYWYLSRNPNITFDIIKDNPDKDWDYESLSLNPNITFDIVINNTRFPKGHDAGKRINWDWAELSMNPNITWDIVRDNQKFPQGHSKEGKKIPWNYYWLSLNPNITLDIVLKNPDIPWNYELLSEHVTWKDVEDNPDKDWDYTRLSRNPNITFDDVKKNLNLNWDWGVLSQNPNITFDDVKKNPAIHWNFDFLSLNPSINWKDVRDNPTLPWNYNNICNNPNFTLKNLYQLGIPEDIILRNYKDNEGYYNDFVFERLYKKYVKDLALDMFKHREKYPPKTPLDRFLTNKIYDPNNMPSAISEYF